MAVKSPPERPVARQPRPSQAVRVKRPRPKRNNERFAHDLWGLGLVAFGFILLVSLILGPHAGLLGNALVLGLRKLVGIGAWAFPCLLVSVGVMLISGREQHTRANFAGGAALLFVIGIAWWHLGHTSRSNEFTDVMSGGGWVGAALSSGLRSLLNTVGSHIFLFFFTIGGIVWATDMRLLHLFAHAVAGGRRVSAPVAQGARAGALAAKAGAAAVKERTQRKSIAPVVAEPASRKAEEKIRKPSSLSIPVTVDELPTVERVSLPSVPTPIRNIVSDEKPKVPEGPLVIPEALGDDGTKHEYVLPPLELLNESPPRPIVQEKDAQEKQAILMQTLNDFKIGANVAQVAIGPTVTRYEVQLEPGILVKKIVSLADNLAMSLAAIDVRVEAPIPGKAAIGIEVPNDIRQMVSLRECLATNEFMNAPSKLTFALGKDVSGVFKYADLTKCRIF